MRVQDKKESTGSAGVLHGDRGERLQRSSQPNFISNLQSTYGNRFVTQLMRSSSNVSSVSAPTIQRSFKTEAMKSEHKRIKQNAKDKKMVHTLHHIIPREKMEKIIKYAEDDNLPESKAFMDNMVQIYEVTMSPYEKSNVSPSKAIQNLPFNLTPGPDPAKLLNNTGAAYDPKTKKVDIADDEIELKYGLSSQQLGGIEYEYREDTGISEVLLEILNLVNSTGQRDGNFWDKMNNRFNSLQTNSINDHAPEEWTKNGDQDQYTRKRSGLNITKDKNNVLRGLLQKRQAPNETIQIAIPSANGINFTIEPIEVKHILERHSLEYFTGEVKGENSFFPVDKSKDDIKNLIQNKVQAKIGPYIESLRKQLDLEAEVDNFKQYEISGKDIQCTFSDGESYIFFNKISMYQYTGDDVEAEAKIITYAPEGTDSIHIPTHVLEAALQ